MNRRNQVPLCAYAPNFADPVRCREPAIGEIPATSDHPAWPLCERHIQPGMHPPRVPLVRWPA